jgi:hypothetical protein
VKTGSLWYEVRCAICERLIRWAFQVAPAGYVPSVVQSAADFYHRGLREGREGVPE